MTFLEIQNVLVNVGTCLIFIGCLGLNTVHFKFQIPEGKELYLCYIGG